MPTTAEEARRKLENQKQAEMLPDLENLDIMLSGNHLERGK